MCASSPLTRCWSSTLTLAVQIVQIGLRGGFMDITPQWQAHVRIGDQARQYGTSDRAVEDEADREEDLSPAPRSVVVEELRKGREDAGRESVETSVES